MSNDLWVTREVISQWIGPLGTNLCEISIKYQFFTGENAFQNVIWKMLAILSQNQCVNP